MAKIARITLVSTNPKSLTKICGELTQICERTGAGLRGPMYLPTKRVIIPVRKSPCGNGTQTWEHYELKVHKRLVDLDAEASVMAMLLKLQVPKDLRIEVQLP